MDIKEKNEKNWDTKLDTSDSQYIFTDRVNITTNSDNCKQLKNKVTLKSESPIKTANHNRKQNEDVVMKDDMETSIGRDATDKVGVQPFKASRSERKNYNEDITEDNKLEKNYSTKKNNTTSKTDDKTQSLVISASPSHITSVESSLGQEQKPAKEGKTAQEISLEEMLGAASNISNNCTAQPINVVRNGTIPNAGKPQLSTMSKKLEQSAKAGRARKPKSAVAMYESELSKHKPGIKLCIKKSETTFNATAAATATATAVSAVVKAINKSASLATAKIRKGSRQIKQRARLYDSIEEPDNITYEPRRKKERSSKKLTSTTGVVEGASTEEAREAIEQSVWGSQLPEAVLFKVFQMLVEKEGSFPTLYRLGRVCSLWRRVSLTPVLWKIMDLTTWTKEKYRSELKLKWFVDNRCKGCTELNVSNWKVTDINCFLHKLADGAPNLTSITLAGWKGFTSDHLAFLVDKMKKLQRLDLSSINVEMNASKSAVGVQSLCNALQAMNERLTHLYLAHNRLAGIPQMVNILSTHCPNLLLLDLSNISTQATSHGILHVEKLQQGCPKLKVLRITNSHITLSAASMQEMMDSPGFPDLEELSVAAVSDESRILGDEHLQRILKTSSKLKLLDVRCCTRLTHESLIRLAAWDIKHLFLSGCSVTRDMGSGLELIASKWAHSLIELDLAWANVQQPLDNALHALADKGAESRLAHLNLCGSSVSEEAVKEILANCPLMSSINLSSCRGLPRGVKRLMQGPQELNELREVLKVQLKVKIPQPSSTASTLQSTTVSSINNAKEGSEGGGGGGGGASVNNSP